MLFGVIFALVCGTAVSAPWNGEHSRNHQRNPWNEESSRRHQMNPWHGEPSRHHQMNPNPFGSSSLTQGFLCDWCVVGVEDFQEKLSLNKDEILAIFNRTAALCDYCPATELCRDFFQYEIPGTIDDILSQSPDQICTEAGVCNENATLPGLVMTGLDSHIARDRVIKRMLKRASALQQNMIRMIMGPDYLCDACHDLLSTTRELLTDNNTQHEVVKSLAPLCDYMPDVFQADCDEFVQSIPSLMDMLANDVLLDSTCNELGLCNASRKDPVVDTLPDILSQLGISDILDGIGQGRNPFQFPGGDRQIPGFQFPGFGRGQPDRNPQAPFGAPIQRPGNPYGNPRPETRPGHHHSGKPRPETPYGKWPTSTNTRPERPQRPYKPRPRPTQAPEPLIPDFNLEDIFGKNPGAGMLDQIPDLPQLPNIRLQGINLNFPGFGNNQRGGFRYRRDAEKIKALKIDLAEPMDKIIEYVPDAIPEAGITITPEKHHPHPTEDCEVCKMAVTAVSSWLQDNEMELQRMALKIVQPFCELFPSPMKEDCTSDVTEFVQTFVKTVVSRLVPDDICSMIGMCSTAVDVPPEAPLPTVDAAAPAQPTTWPLLP